MKRILCLTLFVLVAVGAPAFAANASKSNKSSDTGGEIGFGVRQASDKAVAYQVGGGTRIFFGKSKTMAFRADLSLLRDTTFNSSTTLTTVTAGMTWKLGGR